MMHRLALSGFLIAVVTASTWAQPGPPHKEQHALLKKVAAAQSTYKFSGERLVVMPRRDGSVRFTEKIWRNGSQLRSEFLGDEKFKGQIIVENKDRRLHLIPSLKIVRESAPRQDEALNFILGMGGQPRNGSRRSDERDKPKFEIKFSESDGGKIAGYNTRLLQMSGSNGRVLQKFWIETNRSFILKHSAFDGNGREWGGFEYRKIQFNPSLSSSLFTLKMPQGYRLITLLDDLKEQAGKLGLKAYRLQSAQGYRLIGVRGIADPKTKVLTQTYTNGKTRLTLYQVKGEFDTDRFKSAAGGRFNVHVWSADGVRFLIMGELSESELKSLAGKVKA